MNNNIRDANGFFKSLIPLVLFGVITTSSAYELIDLGENVVPNAINNTGVVVGSSNTNQYPATAFYWSSDSGIKIIQNATSANAVNDNGQIVGNTITGAFILDGSNYHEWNEYAAFGNNQSGKVAGYKVEENLLQPRSLPYDPAIYDGSQWDVFTIASLYSRGTEEDVYADRFILNGINTEGFSVGYKYRYGLAGSAAILIDPDVIVNDLSDVVYLPTPAGGRAADINDNYMIVGTTGSDTSAVPVIYTQAYIYDYSEDNEDSLFILPVLEGGLRSNAYDINEHNQVVGNSETLVDSIKVKHAFLWNHADGVLTDLNDFLANGSITAPGWVLTTANAINDNGDIVGTGLLNGVAHGFLITTEDYDDDDVPPPVTEGLPPVAVATADVYSGKTPLLVNFDSSESTDPDGSSLRYFWDFMDGSSSTEANPSHEFTKSGSYQVTLTVTDEDDMQASTSITITASKRENHK
ncbi:MAG: PKD domain-containing protein [Gammaproteobacteria bacterium]|nr:PKD domain-containing protein [Gammaproteobacteria bacterium]